MIKVLFFGAAADRAGTRETGLDVRDSVTLAEIWPLIVEQHAQKILPITDRALILDRGRIVHQSPSAALLADPTPLERFLGVAGS